jgi:hypothetical protein
MRRTIYTIYTQYRSRKVPDIRLKRVELIPRQRYRMRQEQIMEASLPRLQPSVIDAFKGFIHQHVTLKHHRCVHPLYLIVIPTIHSCPVCPVTSTPVFSRVLSPVRQRDRRLKPICQERRIGYAYSLHRTRKSNVTNRMSLTRQA